MSGIVIPPNDITVIEYPKDPLIPQWDRFRGNQNERMPRIGELHGGGISFREHLDKPLSDRLWMEIVKYLHPRTMGVFAWGASVWTIGRWKHVQITMNEDGETIHDIKYNP